MGWLWTIKQSFEPRCVFLSSHFSTTFLGVILRSLINTGPDVKFFAKCCFVSRRMTATLSSTAGNLSGRPTHGRRRQPVCVCRLTATSSCTTRPASPSGRPTLAGPHATGAGCSWMMTEYWCCTRRARSSGPPNKPSVWWWSLPNSKPACSVMKK